MRCQHCGSEVQENTRFCAVCGSPVSLSENTVYAAVENTSGGVSSINLQKDAEPAPQQQFNQALNQGFNVPPAIPQMQPANNFNQQFQGGQQNNFGQQPIQNNFGQQPYQSGQKNDFGQQPFLNNQQSNFAQQPYQNGQPMTFVEPNLTKEQFANAPQLAGWRRNFKTTYIIGYVCSALMLIGLFSVGAAALIDVAIVLGTNIGVHLKRSRGCAIGMLVYAIINTIIGIVSSGMLSGWLILATAICAVKMTYDFEKFWQSYQTTGFVPTILPNGRRPK